MNIEAICEELYDAAKYLEPDCILVKAADKLREQAAEIQRLKEIIEEF
jgi:hypothetical protein